MNISFYFCENPKSILRKYIRTNISKNVHMFDKAGENYHRYVIETVQFREMYLQGMKFLSFFGENIHFVEILCRTLMICFKVFKKVRHLGQFS
jgi:hypothetical protein